MSVVHRVNGLMESNSQEIRCVCHTSDNDLTERLPWFSLHKISFNRRETRRQLVKNRFIIQILLAVRSFPFSSSRKEQI